MGSKDNLMILLRILLYKDFRKKKKICVKVNVQAVNSQIVTEITPKLHIQKVTVQCISKGNL